MRIGADVRLDGSPPAVERLGTALADALDGGPAVFPLKPTAYRRRSRPKQIPEQACRATSGSGRSPRIVVLPPLASLREAGRPASAAQPRGCWRSPASHVADVEVIFGAPLDLRGAGCAGPARRLPVRRLCSAAALTGGTGGAAA